MPGLERAPINQRVSTSLRANFGSPDNKIITKSTVKSRVQKKSASLCPILLVTFEAWFQVGPVIPLAEHAEDAESAQVSRVRLKIHAFLISR